MLLDWILPGYEGFALLLVEFLLAAGVVLGLSVKLTQTADRLEQITPLSEMWIGMLLLAFVTSLPEAVNSIGATFIDGALNLGVGNLTGSNMFNIAIIVVLDLLQGPGPILLMVRQSQVFIAAGGILLMGLVGSAIARYIPIPGLAAPTLLTGIGFSIAIFLAFLVTNWLLIDRDDPDPTSAGPSSPPDAHKTAALPSLRHTSITFVITAALVVAASIWLLRICNIMALRPISLGRTTFTLGHSFVGSFLLGVATSLPELFVSIGALKLGRLNMSVANILGSNLMNMSFIPIMHLVTGTPNFYAAISPASLVMLFAAIIMTTLFIVGLMARSTRSLFFLSKEAIIILAVYIAAAALVFRMGNGG